MLDAKPKESVESTTVRYRQVSVCAPAVPMWYIDAWAERNAETGEVESDYHVYPVVAIRSHERLEYVKHGLVRESGHDLTRRELREAGWQMCGRDVESVPLVVDVEGNIVDAERVTSYGVLAAATREPSDDDHDANIVCEEAKVRAAAWLLDRESRGLGRGESAAPISPEQIERWQREEYERLKAKYEPKGG